MNVCVCIQRVFIIQCMCVRICVGASLISDALVLASVHSCMAGSGERDWFAHPEN